ncbi:MAG: hypothetical protein QOG83_635 [Alphaproteobacteria bacterium]|nr:hypothetical protein [Alphaproteobacteria bacterium]
MQQRTSIGAIALLLALVITCAVAEAFDQSKYPDWKGVWERRGSPRWTPAGEKPPLTPEYQAIFDWNTADQQAGGHGSEPSWTCAGPGMPRIMNVYEPMEIIVTPATIYMLISHIHDNRRIYTDGREWPKELEPAYKGTSIGKWIDEDGDGKYDVLEIETRGMKSPRAYDTTGVPLHSDGKTIVKERLYLDKKDRMILWNEVTTIDSALTGPWTVKKQYFRDPSPKHNWIEEICAENNPHVRIGKDNYMLSADGLLMPARKGQQPPDLRYFKSTQK